MKGDYVTTYGWSGNWSGRGIAMQNIMETARIGTSRTKRTEVSKEDKHMLRDLLRKHPDNNFYKSLALQLVKKGGLTTKQVQSIHADFEKLQLELYQNNEPK